MRVSWNSYSIQKFGNQHYENEDAVYPSIGKKVFFERRCFRCAVSDGATMSSFSTLWARLLVSQVSKDSPRKLRKSVLHAQNEWKKIISNYDLPWFAEIKANQGAFATLLLVQIRKYKTKSGGIWRCKAIGDSCLFQIRNNQLINHFPINYASSFNNTPYLLSSLEFKNNNIWEKHLTKKFGKWESGDQILLMTDALAHWFLASIEDGLQPDKYIKDEIINDNDSQTAFSKWINSLRNSKKIRNDDSTLIWISLN